MRNTYWGWYLLPNKVHGIIMESVDSTCRGCTDTEDKRSTVLLMKTLKDKLYIVIEAYNFKIWLLLEQIGMMKVPNQKAMHQAAKIGLLLSSSIFRQPCSILLELLTMVLKGNSWVNQLRFLSWFMAEYSGAREALVFFARKTVAKWFALSRCQRWTVHCYT